MECNFTPATCTELTAARLDVADAKARVENLEGWQRAQNGHLGRIDDRLDGIKSWLVGIMATSAGSMLLVVLSYLLSRK